MNVGDEIVAIGDTPVCTSSYQEICDLMHDLPVTLTLEIQKPVSGQLTQMIAMLLLFEVFFFKKKYVQKCGKTVSDLVFNMQHCLTL